MLSEILMRAFILRRVRRVELVAAGVGDVVLLGSTHSAGTLRLKEFLMRNGHPYSYIDLERDIDNGEPNVIHPLYKRYDSKVFGYQTPSCHGDKLCPKRPSLQLPPE